MVTHGGIDGYSRMIIYLQCSGNNQADTVYRLFLKAVEEFGLPSRARSELGGETTWLPTTCYDTKVLIEAA